MKIDTSTSGKSHISRKTPSLSLQTRSRPIFPAKKGPDPNSTEAGADTPIFQPKLTIQAANDPLEREADAAADKIMALPHSNLVANYFGEPVEVALPNGQQLSKRENSVRKLGTESSVPSSPAPGQTAPLVQESELPMEEIQEKEETPKPAKDFAPYLNATKGTGFPLPKRVRNRMERGFGADFSAVRIHTDAAAIKMSRSLHAQAFTHGKDIYFNEGKYQPESRKGEHLLAHELTHTLQQGAVNLQRQAEEGEIQASWIEELVQDMLSLAGSFGISAQDLIDYIPGYKLFSYVVEYDILRGERVQRSPHTLLQGLMGITPGGTLLFQKLDEYGLIDKAFEFINSQIASIGFSLSRIEKALEDAWNEMGLTLGIEGNLEVLRKQFTGLYTELEAFATAKAQELLEWVKEALITPLVAYLEENSDAYRLATKVLGQKFPSEEAVEAPTVEILKDFLLLIGKTTEVEEMEKKGTLQETADWIDTQLETFFSILDRMHGIVEQVFALFSLDDLADIPGAFADILDQYLELLADYFAFAYEVASKVFSLIQDSLLGALSDFASLIPGFHLLSVIIERDPFTGEPVERTTENIIRGFMGLVPGGESRFQELKESGVIEQAVSQIEALVQELNMTPQAMVQLFLDIWNGLSIDDLVDPLAAFERIVAQFGEPISRLVLFVGRLVIVLVELLLNMMGIPPELIHSIISQTLEAIETIKNDPINFLINLVRAMGLGFKYFFENFLTHLLDGLQKWLFGQLEEANIKPPPDFSLQSILQMALDILGITLDNVLDRLEKKIGKEKVDMIRSGIDKLEGAWEFITEFYENPASIFDHIKDQLSQLWSVVTTSISTYIMEKVVIVASLKILASLEPTGIVATINGCIAFYDAVMVVINRIREMLEILNSFTKGILDIAKGSLTQAAQYLEQALAQGLPPTIDFLARTAGLGRLGRRLASMIEKAREVINNAIDWLIDKVLQGGAALVELGKAGVAKVMDWWNLKEEYTDASGEEHTLYFEGSGNNAKLMRASSKPKVFEKYVDNLGSVPYKSDLQNLQEKLHNLQFNEDKGGRTSNLNRKIPLVELHDGLGSIRLEPESLSSDNKVHPGEAIELVIRKIVEILTSNSSHISNFTELKTIYFPFSRLVENSTQMRTINVGSEKINVNEGKKLLVSPLTMTTEGSELRGSKAKLYSELYNFVNNKGYSVVAGHLLYHLLHGPGDKAWNLAPISEAANSEMNNYEGTRKNTAFHKIFYEGKILSYSVEMIYDNDTYSSKSVDDARDLLPNKIDMRIREMRYTGSREISTEVEKSKTINELKNPDKYEIDTSKTPIVSKYLDAKPNDLPEKKTKTSFSNRKEFLDLVESLMVKYFSGLNDISRLLSFDQFKTYCNKHEEPENLFRNSIFESDIDLRTEVRENYENWIGDKIGPFTQDIFELAANIEIFGNFVSGIIELSSRSILRENFTHNPEYE